MKPLLGLLFWLPRLLFSATLTAPLFSFGAAGQLAKSLVFFSWKGLKVVRSYVVPANPKTANQTTQRSHMTAAVAEWHAATYTADDVTAWNRLAGIAAAIMSGFNRMCQEFITEIIAGNTWERLEGVAVSGVVGDLFTVTVNKAAGGNAPTLWWGTRKTHFPNSVAMADLGGDEWRNNCSGLTAATLYYFYIDVGSTGTDYGRTGIYQQRTT